MSTHCRVPVVKRRQGSGASADLKISICECDNLRLTGRWHQPRRRTRHQSQCRSRWQSSCSCQKAGGSCSRPGHPCCVGC
eukprot:scaffold38932_cov18-Tisochrysis_lutea.AAC.3